MSNQYYFLGTCATFIQAASKIFCRVNGTLILRVLINFVISTIAKNAKFKTHQIKYQQEHTYSGIQSHLLRD